MAIKKKLVTDNGLTFSNEPLNFSGLLACSLTSITPLSNTMHFTVILYQRKIFSLVNIIKSRQLCNYEPRSCNSKKASNQLGSTCDNYLCDCNRKTDINFFLKYITCK